MKVCARLGLYLISVFGNWYWVPLESDPTGNENHEWIVILSFEHCALDGKHNWECLTKVWVKRRIWVLYCFIFQKQYQRQSKNKTLSTIINKLRKIFDKESCDNKKQIFIFGKFIETVFLSKRSFEIDQQGFELALNEEQV